MTPPEIEALIDRKLEEKLAPISVKLDGIIRLLDKFEGAGTVMKLLFLGVAPVVAALVWIKEHVKF